MQSSYHFPILLCPMSPPKRFMITPSPFLFQSVGSLSVQSSQEASQGLCVGICPNLSSCMGNLKVSLR